MKKILMIEDNQALLELMKSKYQALDLEFLSLTYPPKNLIEVITNFLPDIISMDVTMPNMDGFTATKIIKTNSETKNIPIFFYTNMGRKQDVALGRALGAIGYFIKTENSPDEVVNWVKSFLG
ncbi:MAG: response regulator [Patescibacteria group bacterium]|jgi:CheY-like chemotaxis protein